VDAVIQTKNVAVILCSGKYLDILWNRCTSYRNGYGCIRWNWFHWL